MLSSHSRWFKLSMFGLLYFVQGSALAYFNSFQKPYLNSLHIDADVIGLLTSILLVPFILKIFIGMLSDRVSLFRRGHRKPYMVLGLLLAALAFAAAGFVLPDKYFMLFAGLTLIGSFSVTLFDSTTDGLAVDTTPRDEQAIVQGSMVGGRAMGYIILSLVFGMLVQYHGYRAVFLIIGASMLIPLAWVLRVREPKERDESHRFEWSAFAALVKPRFLMFAAYAVMYCIVAYGVDGLVTFYLSENLRVPEMMLGTYGALRGVGAVLGALAAGLLIDRLGRKESAYGIVPAISLSAALITLMPGVNGVLVMGFVWGIVWAFQDTVFVALAMDLSDVRIAASMFAIMMALSNVGTAIGEGVATGLTDDLGFALVFRLLAGVNIVILPILWGLFRVAPELGRRAAS